MIRTERLCIRKLLPRDWQVLKSLSADFMRSAYAAYDTYFPQEKKACKRLCLQFVRSGLWFSVLLGDEMIGYVCFHEDTAVYDIGYCFHSAYHGKGYAYESCKALMDYLQRKYIVHAFTAGTALKNTPSCNLLAKLGFELTGREELSFHKDAGGNDILFEGGIFQKNVK